MAERSDPPVEVVADSRDEITRQIRNLVYATVALYVVLGALSFAGFLFAMSQRARDRTTLHALLVSDQRQRATIKLLSRDTVALCLLQTDRKRNIADTNREIVDARRQIADTEKYLANHPSGAPALGVSADDIKRSIAVQKTALEGKAASVALQEQTVESLAVVACPKPKKKPTKKGAKP